MMRTGPYWTTVFVAALALHALILLTVRPPTQGVSEPPAGPPVAISGSLASVLGGAVATEQATAEPIDDVTPDTTAEAPNETAEVTETTEPLAPASVAPKTEVSPTKARQPTEVDPAEAVMANDVSALPVPEPNVETEEVTAQSVSANAVTAVQSGETALPETVEAVAPVRLAPPNPSRIKRPTQRTKPARKAKPRRTGSKPKKAARRPAKAKQKRASRRSSSQRGSRTQGSAGRSQGGRSGRGRASPGAVRGYAARVRARILSNRPGASGRGRVVVSFGLSSSGSLRYARIVRRSGNAALDRAALAAVRRSSPFPRPPKGATARQLTFSIPFSFR